LLSRDLPELGRPGYTRPPAVPRRVRGRPVAGRGRAAEPDV